ncbi:hypothetical protein BI364_08805 [Acidihalobacter yilgarnensis]|uniref:DoxX family protein n=1 Tax=Acidihalobacter yilgarnensis TaxID=2819280 RepID=A0A1D8INJ2_9GAMM|nr:DoxX family protein [Acidihalobacter yilgarnensis]AOU98048.1 hypothetical protein BI364_08805 [Acidihalobacter yilgarnensis]
MILDKPIALYVRIAQLLDKASPLADLLLRLWVAEVFWRAGVVKLQSIYSTLYLFQYEYHVPFLPPEVAAYLATGIELGFPVLLALGLFTRFTAGFLFVYNIMAVISYPALWATGFIDHKVWGIMLLVTLLHGPGALSIDAVLRRWWPAAPRRSTPQRLHPQ